MKAVYRPLVQEGSMVVCPWFSAEDGNERSSVGSTKQY
jgi:hypothetical protein